MAEKFWKTAEFYYVLAGVGTVAGTQLATGLNSRFGTNGALVNIAVGAVAFYAGMKLDHDGVSPLLIGVGAGLVIDGGLRLAGFGANGTSPIESLLSPVTSAIAGIRL
jgi:hypothetical protein